MINTARTISQNTMDMYAKHKQTLADLKAWDRVQQSNDYVKAYYQGNFKTIGSVVIGKSIVIDGKKGVLVHDFATNSWKNDVSEHAIRDYINYELDAGLHYKLKPSDENKNNTSSVLGFQLGNYGDIDFIMLPIFDKAYIIFSNEIAEKTVEQTKEFIHNTISHAVSVHAAGNISLSAYTVAIKNWQTINPDIQNSIHNLFLQKSAFNQANFNSIVRYIPVFMSEEIEPHYTDKAENIRYALLLSALWDLYDKIGDRMTTEEKQQKADTLCQHAGLSHAIHGDSMEDSNTGFVARLVRQNTAFVHVGYSAYDAKMKQLLNDVISYDEYKKNLSNYPDGTTALVYTIRNQINR